MKEKTEYDADKYERKEREVTDRKREPKKERKTLVLSSGYQYRELLGRRFTKLHTRRREEQERRRQR